MTCARQFGTLVLALVAVAGTRHLAAAEPNDASEVLDFANVKIPGLIYTPIGVTRHGTPIPAFIGPDDLDFESKKWRITIIAGFDGSRRVVNQLAGFLERFQTAEEFREARTKTAFSAVLCANPDGYFANSGESNSTGAKPGRSFPPPSDAYASRTVPEAQYLWRWLELHAPDFVDEWTASMDQQVGEGSFFLSHPPFLGNARTSIVSIPLEGPAFLEKRILEYMRRDEPPKAPVEIKPGALRHKWRVARSPRETAEELLQFYGQKLPTVQYIPALALVGRLRLGAMTNDASQRAEVEQIVAPYLSGEKPALSPKSGGSEFAGHLIFAELFHTAPADDPAKEKYLRLVKAVADLAFDENNKPRPSMPAHSEMSDAVFMSCPILAEAGRITGEAKYYDACLRHLRFMQKLVLRKDGLYRHSPLDEAAWGRGNGFPALGLAWTLSAWPESQPGRKEIVESLKAHLEVLLPYQDVTGCWHQVIDHPESYREFTCTAMITLAMARGVRSRWLPREKFAPAIDRGWQAVKLRIGDDGTLVDVCTGTGKQPNLQAYFDRLAIFGRDDRGGAMALMVATEMMAYQRDATKQ